MGQWPLELFDFAYFPIMDDHLRNLDDVAEPEDWSYHNTESEHPFPILFNYVWHTYRRVAQQGKIRISEDEEFACFNTGLVTEDQEPLYASFQINLHADRQPWFFKDWLREGEGRVSVFSKLPDMASYFDDPSDLVFDTRKDFRLNIHHFIRDDETRERFPEEFRLMDDHKLRLVLESRDWLRKKTGAS